MTTDKERFDLHHICCYTYFTSCLLFCQDVIRKKFMFFKKLKELRIKSGLSQTQLAKQLGVSQQSYARWESGKYTPTLDTIQKVSNYFNISIEELISDKPLSLERILSSETITFQDNNLSDKQLDNLKQFVKELIEDNL